MKNLLSSLTKLVNLLESNSSQIMKKTILKSFPQCKEILKLVYDKNYIFNITGNNVLKYEKLNFESGIEYFDIYKLLNDLNKRKITGDLALQCCQEFINNYIEFEDIIIKILNKDLKCGISLKIINNVFKNLIPEFNVPLAKNYEEKLCDFENEKWYYSRKLDGIRCLTFMQNNEIKFFSRKGKEIFTLNNLKNDILKNIYIEGYIFDGEICLIDNLGNEDFKGIMKEIRRKNHTIKNPKYFIFDFYSIEEFNGGKILDYNETNNLFNFNNLNLKNTKYCFKINQNYIKSEQEFLKIFTKIPKNWEGIILKKYPTMFKRSNNLLKVKKFKEIELRVINIVLGEKFINENHQSICSALVCKYKNNIIYIGSGLSDKQRVKWFNSEKEIIGKIITVKYFEESQNKDGKYSLRFPILKYVHGEQREL